MANKAINLFLNKIIINLIVDTHAFNTRDLFNKLFVCIQ